jgi:hypothetical protein
MSNSAASSVKVSHRHFAISTVSGEEALSLHFDIQSSSILPPVYSRLLVKLAYVGGTSQILPPVSVLPMVGLLAPGSGVGPDRVNVSS